jgi:hypothetical protein
MKSLTISWLATAVTVAVAHPRAEDYSTAITINTSVYSRDAQLRINCRGSIRCLRGGCDGPDIHGIKRQLDAIPDDRIVVNGEQIVCLLCKPQFGFEGVCLFPQRLP